MDARIPSHEINSISTGMTSDFCFNWILEGNLMPEVTKLIEELAALIEAGNTVDSDRIVQIRGEIAALHQSLRAQFGEKNESVRAARAAENLIEKIILEYVGRIPLSGDARQSMASPNESAQDR